MELGRGAHTGTPTSRPNDLLQLPLFFYIFMFLYFSLLFPRHGSGGSMFARRADFSSFNVLPRDKINSYHIKVGADLVQFIHVVLFAHSPVCFPNGNNGNDSY